MLLGNPFDILQSVPSLSLTISARVRRGNRERLIAYRSSSRMISISRIGSTSPSTWITSASSKAPKFTKHFRSASKRKGRYRSELFGNLRTTWKIPSTARTLAKKLFPNPAPVEAPLVKPAISTQVRTAGTFDEGWYCSQSQSNRAANQRIRFSLTVLANMEGREWELTIGNGNSGLLRFDSSAVRVRKRNWVNIRSSSPS